MPSLFLAWRYLRARPGQSAVMILGLALALYLPLVTHRLVDEFDRTIGARAANTPLVIGPKGSRFDLALHGLYFRARNNGTVPYSEYTRLVDRHDGTMIPLHSKFTAKGYPVVGTTVDYFHFRNIGMQPGGKTMRQVGDCELGATVAKELGLGPGDTILTDRENLFDLAGDYPLQLNITAVLAPTGTADDTAIFVELKTAWIIEGIGHGHDPDLDHNGTSPKLVKTHLEITPENVESFHFHGDSASFPLTALLARAEDAKGQALMLADYQDNPTIQILKTPEVMAELMGMILRVRDFLDAHHVLVATAMGALLALIIALTRRLRAREMETLTLLGCRLGLLLTIQVCEILLTLGLACTLAILGSICTVKAWSEILLHFAP